jgi:LDH2 family malate/lactate/ureidoglycolate dehydrogenase
LPVPKEWANPETGALRPLGGHEPNSNYKGFGLAFFVEIFCGILSDSAYGPNIRKYGNFTQGANLGHCFVALNPTYFAPGFEERLSDLMNFIRNMQPVRTVLKWYQK